MPEPERSAPDTVRHLPGHLLSGPLWSSALHTCGWAHTSPLRDSREDLPEGMRIGPASGVRPRRAVTRRHVGPAAHLTPGRRPVRKHPHLEAQRTGIMQAPVASLAPAARRLSYAREHSQHVIPPAL